MFEYLDKQTQKSLNTKLGTFLSTQVDWLDSEKNLISYDIVNSWDRKKIAERYLEEKIHWSKSDITYNCIGGIANKQLCIDELSIKIDQLIPKRYFIKYCQFHNIYNTSSGLELGNKFISKDSHDITKRLIFHYDHKESKAITYIPATARQISYISSLAKNHGYMLKTIDGLTLSIASEIIEFLSCKTDDISSEAFSYLQYE